jgi:hypothetical protein
MSLRRQVRPGGSRGLSLSGWQANVSAFGFLVVMAERQRSSSHYAEMK